MPEEVAMEKLSFRIFYRFWSEKPLRYSVRKRARGSQIRVHLQSQLRLVLSRTLLESSFQNFTAGFICNSTDVCLIAGMELIYALGASIEFEPLWRAWNSSDRHTFLNLCVFWPCPWLPLSVPARFIHEWRVRTKLQMASVKTHNIAFLGDTTFLHIIMLILRRILILIYPPSYPTTFRNDESWQPLFGRPGGDAIPATKLYVG